MKHERRVPRGRAIVLLVGLGLTVEFGPGTLALASQPGAVGSTTLAEPFFCDTEQVALNHRFSPIGHVDLDTGSYVFDLVDVGASDPSGLFTRSYHSRDTRTTLLGPGWMDNFEVRIRKDSSQRDAIFTGPDGFTHGFEDAWQNNEVIKARGSSATLAKDDSGGYIVTYDRHKWTLDSSGSLIRVDHPDGEWVEVHYVGGHLADSVGSSGAKLVFDVRQTSAGDRLVLVTGARESKSFVEFDFDDAGRLIRAAPSSSPTRRYIYHGDSERLATIADDSGAVLISVAYDDLGRVARLQDALGLLDGEAEFFVYEDLPEGRIRTTVTHPQSRVEPDWNPVQIVTHDSEHRVIEAQLQPTSAQTFIGRYFYDNYNQRIPVDAPCPTLTVPPTGGSVAGSCAAFSIMFSRVVVVLAYLIQVFLSQIPQTISI